MTNSDNGGRLAEELILTLSNLYGWPGIRPVERSVAQVPVATLNSLAGTYAVLTGGDNGKTEDFDVAREDAALVMTYNGEKVSTLLPESDRKFFDSDSGMPVEFSLEDKAATIVIGGWGRGVRHSHD
jgi:hypothetical protein